jgi:sec-independent protein translocase protein TatB
MFNVGGGEIIVILIAALIVLGPDKLPNAARQGGKYLAEFRRISDGFQEELRSAMDLSAVTDPSPEPVEHPPAEPSAETASAPDSAPAPDVEPDTAPDTRPATETTPAAETTPATETTPAAETAPASEAAGSAAQEPPLGSSGPTAA